MAQSKLKGVIKRQLPLPGIDAPVIMAISESGVEMAVAGFKTKLFANWETIAKALRTPPNVPSFCEGRPMDLLRYQANKHRKKHEEDNSAS
jgi:hypothetical protein